MAKYDILPRQIEVGKFTAIGYKSRPAYCVVMCDGCQPSHQDVCLSFFQKATKHWTSRTQIQKKKNHCRQGKKNYKVKDIKKQFLNNRELQINTTNSTEGNKQVNEDINTKDENKVKRRNIRYIKSQRCWGGGGRPGEALSQTHAARHLSFMEPR